MSESTTPSLVRLPVVRAAQDPEGPCITDDAGAMDNATFAVAVGRLADRLARMGISQGDTVAVMLPNCSEIVTTMFAAWSRGGRP